MLPSVWTLQKRIGFSFKKLVKDLSCSIILRWPCCGGGGRTSPRWTMRNWAVVYDTTMTRTSSVRQLGNAMFIALSATCRTFSDMSLRSCMPCWTSAARVPNDLYKCTGSLHHGKIIYNWFSEIFWNSEGMVVNFKKHNLAFSVWQHCVLKAWNHGQVLHCWFTGKPHSHVTRTSI